ncbi:hypothetical protein DIPPA_10270 [Diplonema papillatum]|nr:hypothetical protein DIPPA_10270 [Diplonema papillatum]
MEAGAGAQTPPPQAARPTTAHHAAAGQAAARRTSPPRAALSDRPSLDPDCEQRRFSHRVDSSVNPTLEPFHKVSGLQVRIVRNRTSPNRKWTRRDLPPRSLTTSGGGPGGPRSDRLDRDEPDPGVCGSGASQPDQFLVRLRSGSSRPRRRGNRNPAGRPGMLGGPTTKGRPASRSPVDTPATVCRRQPGTSEDPWESPIQVTWARLGSCRRRSFPSEDAGEERV